MTAGSQEREVSPDVPFSWCLPLPDKQVKDKWDLHDWQLGRCGLCGIVDRLVLDHCHATGWVRGWLCHGCNVSEGMRWSPWLARYRWVPPAVLCGLLGLNYYTERYRPPVGRLIFGDYRYVGPLSVADAAASLERLESVPDDAVVLRPDINLFDWAGAGMSGL